MSLYIKGHSVFSKCETQKASSNVSVDLMLPHPSRKIPIVAVVGVCISTMKVTVKQTLP